MIERGNTGIEHLPYELTAEQVAKEAIENLRERYGDNPHVLLTALQSELPSIVHDAMELGMGLAETFGDIPAAELLVAYAAGANENKGEKPQ